MPLLIAHRGDTVHFPENTLAAFDSAFSLGSDGIEFDVQMDKHGELIVVHNYLYDKSKIYPRFSDVLEKYRELGRLEIEIKSFDPRCIEKVGALLVKINPHDFEITSSVLPLLPIMRKRLPNARIGMIFKSILLEEWMTPSFVTEYLSGYMELTHANVLHLDLDRYTSQIVQVMHKSHYVLHSHLKSADLAEYEKAKELGIEQCTFDDINLLKKV